MADTREVFTSLENLSTGEGMPLHQAFEGSAAEDRNAHGALVAKDTAGNLIYLKTNLAGELVTSLESEEFALISDSGTHTGNVAYQNIVTLVLQADLVYKELELVCSCFRDAVFQIVAIDDVGVSPVETILINGIRAGAGQFSAIVSLKTFMFTAGSTGVQNLVIRGKNLNSTSTMDVVASVKEIQAP